MQICDILPGDIRIFGRIPDVDIEKCTASAKNIGKNTVYFHLPHTDTSARSCPNFEEYPICIVTEDHGVSFPKGIPIITVRSSRRAYAYACYKLSDFDQRAITLVGVGGSCGKTTTATLIYEMARACGVVAGFIGTGKIISKTKTLTDDSYTMTTPDPELLYPTLKRMQDEGVRLVVMEASSHALYLSKLAPLSFDIGIFTGLSQEHLDFHKTMEEYFLAKSILYEKSSLSIISVADEYGKRLYEKNKTHALSVGIDEGACAYAKFEGECSINSCEISYRMPGVSDRCKSALFGDFNLINIMLSLCTMKALGYDTSVCKEVLRNIKIDGRQSVITDGALTVVRDFAHTPFELDKLLSSLYSILNLGQSLTIVFGCGGERDREKRPKMLKSARKYASRIIITSDNPRGEGRGNILFDMLKDDSLCEISIILDRALAIEHAILTASENEVVVIAGKGHEKYIIEGDKFLYFSEEEIIKSALKKRKEARL